MQQGRFPDGMDMQISGVEGIYILDPDIFLSLFDAPVHRGGSEPIQHSKCKKVPDEEEEPPRTTIIDALQYPINFGDCLDDDCFVKLRRGERRV